MRVSALFVEKHGIYSELGVDLWDMERDARLYRGPNPVVAHPPCKRWGRYWGGGPSAKVKRILGDDEGCFAAALFAVRTYGGVLEHPEASHAWRWFGLPRPNRGGAWNLPDSFGGRSCCVEQGHYGHRARKATWLYAVGTSHPNLIWGKAEGKIRLDPGFRTTAERKSWRESNPPIARVSAYERLATPEPFARLLIELAASATPTPVPRGALTHHCPLTTTKD